MSVAEHGVEKWARDNSKNYARTFSAIGSGIKQYIPFSNTEFSKKILSELDNLVGGKAYTRHRNEREPWQRVFVVPAKGTADEFEYMVGYYWGIVLAVFGYFNLITQVSGILEVLLLIAKKEPDFWGLVKQEARQFFKKLNNPRLSAFQQGKIASTVKLNLVFTVLGIIGLVKGVQALSTRLAQLAESIAPQVRRSKAMLAAMESVIKFKPKSRKFATSLSQLLANILMFLYCLQVCAKKP